jgi:hypothetical protein
MFRTAIDERTGLYLSTVTQLLEKPTRYGHARCASSNLGDLPNA